jgi:hypothetical protein
LKLAGPADINRVRLAKATSVRRPSAVPLRRRTVPPEIEAMSKLSRFLFLLAFILVLGGVIFLLTWEIPPPTAPVEVTIPDERLPR